MHGIKLVSNSGYQVDYHGCRAAFVFKGIKRGIASIGLLVPGKTKATDELHDFLMTVEQIDSNLASFGKHPELVKAKEALLKMKK